MLFLETRLLCFDLILLLPDECLLLFRRLNQERYKAGVVHPLRIHAILFVRHYFGDYLPYLFSDDADFVLAIIPTVVRDPTELIDILQRSSQALDISLPSEGASRRPGVRKRGLAHAHHEDGLDGNVRAGYAGSSN